MASNYPPDSQAMQILEEGGIVEESPTPTITGRLCDGLIRSQNITIEIGIVQILPGQLNNEKQNGRQADSKFKIYRRTSLVSESKPLVRGCPSSSIPGHPYIHYTIGRLMVSVSRISSWQSKLQLRLCPEGVQCVAT